MMLTDGAVKSLKRGAMLGTLDINAVTDDGVQHEAGQICSEDDHIMRSAMGYDEFRPVLEVRRTEWFGRNLGPCPMVKFWCVDSEDGDEEVCVMASPRLKHKFAKKFYSKGGPFNNGRLKVGRRFQLVDYTTRVVMKDRIHDGKEPIVHVEKIRCAPIRRTQTKMKSFLSKNNPRLQGDMSHRASDADE